MARQLLDSTKAYRLLLEFKETPTEDRANDAYNAVDECAEIALRASFARCPTKDILDDLRQAGRLRIFQCLGKMAEICDSPEFYVRLAIQTARRAMLTEYARLKKQGAKEVSLYESSAPGGDDEHYSEVEDMEARTADPFVVMGTEFDQFEQRLLLDQATNAAFRATREELIRHFRSRAYKEAAVFVLLMMFRGHDTSDFWIHETWGVKDPRGLQQFVLLTFRRVIQEGLIE